MVDAKEGCTFDILSTGRFNLPGNEFVLSFCNITCEMAVYIFFYISQTGFHVFVSVVIRFWDIQPFLAKYP